MDCPYCGAELTTLTRGLCPMEQRDEVRGIDGDTEGGLRVESTGETEVRQGEGTRAWVECPACGHGLDDVIPGGVESVDSPTPTSETVGVAGQAEARGRNGWFRPAEVTVQRAEAEGTIRLTVRSSRAYVDVPPIYLSITLADARSLHRALRRQIAAVGTVGPTTRCVP